MSIISTNKKAQFQYQILEVFQAGLALSSGGLVKMIRSKTLTPDHSFVVFQNNRLEAIGMGTAKDDNSSIALLLTRSEITKIRKATKEKGVTCILLNFKRINKYLKADIAIVKGKNQQDKRETIKDRDQTREKARGLT